MLASPPDPGDEPERKQPLNEVLGATAIYPQAQGELQIALKPVYRDRRRAQIGYLAQEIEIGATDWWQFDISWVAPIVRGGQGSRPTVGSGDLELATQLTWMNMGRSPVSAALAFEVGFPTGRPQNDLTFGEGNFVYRPFTTLALDWPDARGQLFVNIGAELDVEQQQPFVNVGTFFVASSVRPGVVFGYDDLRRMTLTPGVNLALGSACEVAVGVPLGLNARADAIGGELMVICQFNLLNRPR